MPMYHYDTSNSKLNMKIPIHQLPLNLPACIEHPMSILYLTLNNERLFDQLKRLMLNLYPRFIFKMGASSCFVLAKNMVLAQRTLYFIPFHKMHSTFSFINSVFGTASFRYAKKELCAVLMCSCCTISHKLQCVRVSFKCLEQLVEGGLHTCIPLLVMEL